ncbi:MAG: hypothetical protein RLZZ04_2382 [Cyanobacteriota bacterium]|jgi:uncharacterized repeat protein (TIGR01451 family)
MAALKNNLMNILLDFLVKINHQNSHKVIQGLGVGTLASLALGSLSQAALADLTITPTTNVTTIGTQLTGENVTISNVTIDQGTIGDQTGVFSGGSIGTAGPLLGIENGVVLVTGTATTADGPNKFSNLSTGGEIGPTSTDLATVDPGAQRDTVTLQFNVVPTGNTLSMEFLFASEEYNEYVCTKFNDAMGIFVSGPGITGTVNIARLDQTLAGFSINEINRGVAGAAANPNNAAPCNTNNSQFFVNNIDNYNELAFPGNTSATIQNNYTNVEYDGFTKPLSASIAVQPNQTYTVKVITADIVDSQWDGGVFVDVINSYNLDYGDAPDSYKTSSVNQAIQLPGPARHSVPLSPNVYLGALPPDVEANGTPTTSPNPADGDDNTGDDEDAFGNTLKIPSGITSHLISGIPVRNTSGQTAKLMGWIDFNLDGDFLDPGEQATVNVAPNQTTAALSWSGFPRIVAGNTYARFRITTDAGLISSPNSAGLAIDGEVEDYQVEIVKYDYGDAPDAATGTGAVNYKTTAADGGASQAVINTPGQILKLGGNLDHDDGSLQNTAANADDNNGTPDDEDGVSNFPSLTTASNKTYTVPVTVSNNVTSKNAFLVGYIDFNKDGDFLDTGEKSTTVTVPTNATNPRTVNVIFTTPLGMTTGNTYARFRLGQDQATAELSTGASNVTDYGEIEDYPIAIATAGNPDLPPDFCQATSHNLLFILDDSSSVDASELAQQRQAVMATLNDFVAKGLVGQAAIVGFDSIGRTVITYTDITSANLASFQTALNTNYGVPGSGTDWEKGFQAGLALGVDQPDIVFFFTDGVTTGRGSPDDEAQQFKDAGAHIYGIGIQGLTVNSGFKGITDGNNTITYNGSNIFETDFLPITDYTTLQNQYTNAFLANLCPADFGDAPDTYGTNNIANNSSNNSEPLGANHGISSGLFIGATAPDVDANGFVDGTDNNNGNATDDDAPQGAGTGNGDDEDNFVLPTLFSRVTNYSIPANNITVTNTKTQPATLHAWIDFNKNGKFDSTEYTSALVSPNTTGGHSVTNLTWSGINLGTVGNTYARFRLTTDSSINSNTSGGDANDGEVEDYQIAIAPRPELLLVKRITAINPGQPGKEIQFSNFVNDPTVNDNHPLWPNSNIYLRGVINAGKVKPDDEVEYTVYFLSSGDVNAKEIKICDVVPDHMTFVKNTYGVELGIGLGFNSTVLPTSPNLKLSNLLNDDQGDFYAPGNAPPANLCKKVTPTNTLVNVNGTNNDNGAVVVKIQNLPKANTPGSPTDSYGFIRFRGKVK